MGTNFGIGGGIAQSGLAFLSQYGNNYGLSKEQQQTMQTAADWGNIISGLKGLYDIAKTLPESISMLREAASTGGASAGTAGLTPEFLGAGALMSMFKQVLEKPYEQAMVNVSVKLDGKALSDQYVTIDQYRRDRRMRGLA